MLSNRSVQLIPHAVVRRDGLVKIHFGLMDNLQPFQGMGIKELLLDSA